jgi:cytochrome c-type biogenesis protein CcmH
MAARLARSSTRSPTTPRAGQCSRARITHSIAQRCDACVRKATALNPRDAGLLADYADAVGAAEGGLGARAQALVERALAADPTQWKALALAGTVAFERKDYAQAVAYWERMKATVPPGSPIAGSIDASIAEARQLGGLKPAPGAAVASAPAAANVPPPRSGAPRDAVTTGATIAGRIELAPALAAKAAPTDTVFIFARAADGPKMPLAILRKQVKDLPVTFTLDDSMAMAPDFALSKFPTVVVGARVSKSGNAAPQAGDLEGFSPAVKVGATGLVVVIDRTRP